MADSTKKISLKTQGAWLLFAKVAGFAISFVLPLLIVRHLTQEKFGVYRQAFQFIVNAVAILPVGFSMSAFYFLSREQENRKSAIFNILLFNFVVGGLACAGLYFYPQFLGNIYKSAEMTQLAPKIGVVIWLWVFSAFLEVVAISNQEARIATVFIVLAQFSKTVLMAGAVMIFGTIESFIYAAMIQAALQTFILFNYLNSRFPKFWREFRWKFFAEQAVYALPFGLAGVIWTLQTDIHTYFVGHRFSAAEYAIYSVGCFQLPLLAMLAESTGAVLISRMSELQAQNDSRQIITLTARAMQKLSFFYFPAYAFMLVTAYTLITTLYTEKFAASVSIFIINLTLLPFDIWILDPIIRAYKKFGRILLILRVFMLTGLIIALWFGIQYFDLRGMIAIVIASSLLERFILSSILLRKLNLRWSDWKLLSGVGKTALLSALVGIMTYFIYVEVRVFAPEVAENLARLILPDLKKSIITFCAGMLTMGITFSFFAPIYLVGAQFLNLIEPEEKDFVKNLLDNLQTTIKKTFRRKSAGETKFSEINN